MDVTVIGTGYVGLVTGICLAEKQHHVICLDIDKKKLKQIQKGKLPIFEKGLNELYQQNRKSVEFTNNYEFACMKADVIIIGVGTPENEDGSANLQYVCEAVKEIIKHLKKNCIVVIKSTVPIGTCDKVEKYINSQLKNDISVEVVSNPEFLAQGTAVEDTLHASRIVIGANTEHAKNVMKELYCNFDVPIIFTDHKSAEMIKYASNDFLALKISYINEIANLCEVVGANVEDVALGMGLDHRIGRSFLKAGIGYGGSCFPKDTKALHWLAANNSCELKTVKAAIEVNEKQKVRLLEKIKKWYPNVKGKSIAVLGLTFKPGTDDIREAPSLVVVPILLREGAHIKAFDPKGLEKFRNEMERIKQNFIGTIEYVDNVHDTLKETDLCLILTEWDEIISLTIEDFMTMKKAMVFDGRNCYAPEMMKGIHYESIGRY